MTQDDVDFSAELEQYLEQHDYDMPQSGDIRKGVIVAVSNEGVIIDLGLKRDGIVPPSDLAKLSEEERARFEPDQEISVYIMETNQDTLNVSIHRALLNEDWIDAEELMNQGEIVEAEVVGYNRGGALVDYRRLRGFVPLSQLSGFRPGMKDRDKQRMLSKLRNETLPLKIIEVDRRRRRLVMSNREAQREWDESRRGELLAELKAGEVVTGRVSSLRDFGAFVELGGGLEGLVHVSELSWHRIDHPNEVISSGDEIEVYILKVDVDSQRVSLSRKRLLPDPWSFVEEKYAINSLVEGKITRIVNYGAFVELEPGIEGLLHASKMIRGSDNADPERVVQVGEIHLLRVINVDSDRQRIGLSLRAVTPKEQIEWMMSQSESEAEEAEESPVEEAPVVAEESSAVVEESEAAPAEETTETVEESAEVTPEVVEESSAAVEESEAAPAEEAAETVEDAAEAAPEVVEESSAVIEESEATPAEETAETVEESAEAAPEVVEESSAVVEEAEAVPAEETAETVEDATEAAPEVVEESSAVIEESEAAPAEETAETVEDAAAADETTEVAEETVEAAEEGGQEEAQVEEDAADSDKED